MNSKYFEQAEFEHDSPIPPESAAVLQFFCEDVLDPMREQAGCSLIVTSGYRPPEANAEAHGQPNSEHIYSADHAAADVVPVDGRSRLLFDWARMNPTLPFHQLILERSQSGAEIVHVSVNRQKPGIRSVLEGATNNATPYVAIPHVEFSA